MDEQDRQPDASDHATRLRSPQGQSVEADNDAAEAAVRTDDQTDDLNESPVPDPEAKDTDAEDVPEAD